MANSFEMLRAITEEIRKNQERIDQREFIIKESEKKGIEIDETKLPKPAFDKKKLQELKIIEKAMRNASGDFSKGEISIKEAITTTDSMKLIPNYVIGNLREAIEPVLLGTNFFTHINIPEGGGATFVIPFISELSAREVGEAQRYETDSVNVATLESHTVEMKVKKVGIKVSITDESMKDNTFDLYNINLRAMGRALARFKEEQVFNLFSRQGLHVFNNDMRNAADPKWHEMCTTGLGKDGQPNDTMSTEDFLNFVLALISQGYEATDVIMHPLTWVVFSKNAMVGNGLSFGAMGGNSVHPWGAIQGTPAPLGFQHSTGDGQKKVLGPGEVQNRLPLPGINLSFSPQVRFDKKNKRFDMYCLDRNNVGIIGQKEALSQDEWKDFETDIHNIKIKERYGLALHDEGRAIMVASNLAAAVTYPVAPEVTVNTKSV